MKNFRICLLGPYGFGNIGDEIILEGILTRLKKKYRNPTIFVSSYDPAETTSKHSRSLAFRMFSYSPLQKIISLIRAIVVILKSNALIIGGGSVGALFFEPEKSLSSRLKSIILSCAWLVLLAKSTGKYVEFHAIGITPSAMWWLTSLALRLADEVSVRDEFSKEQLPPFVKRRAKVIRDPAFELSSIEAKGEPQHKLVGFCLGGVKEKETRRLITRKTAETINEILYNPTIDVVLIPFDKHKFQLLENDLYFALDIVKMVKNKRCCIFNGATIYDYLQLFRKLDVCVAMRLHAVILSIIYHVPCVAIDIYNEKIKFEYYGVPVVRLSEWLSNSDPHQVVMFSRQALEIED